MVPSYDPFGWLVWGRQTVHLALDPIGAPTWKPLPWLVTTPLALTGGAAPTLWLIAACAAGLAALWLAYGLGHRLGGAVGGAVAVGVLLLCRNWFDYLLTGNVEPATVALVLGAAEGHVRGRQRLAFVLLALAALMRPEAALHWSSTEGGYGARTGVPARSRQGASRSWRCCGCCLHTSRRASRSDPRMLSSTLLAQPAIRSRSRCGVPRS